MNLLVLLPLLGLLLVVTAEIDPRLVGTWTTKSRKVVTGPGFYDPVNDKLIEPSLTGMSYSFSDDGFFEEAQYRAVSNPTNPECPKGYMLFQHGKYEIHPNGSLVLDPTYFQDDGRKLESNPCKGKMATYSRINQIETFKRYEVQLDEFHGIQRLNLYGHDGAPVNRMFLVYKPPQMLPTKHLNPTVHASKRKRDVVDGLFNTPLDRHSILPRQLLTSANMDRWWWLGVVMTFIGGIALFYS
ncbi:ROT1 protein [Arthroderma uncinatum]|uniref:ROT1 protein n=1 Tax=Arthroderma uncinatum TaxID=74035 RepID=UPI00144A5A49|nr:ROT1 protein [Arthroderma uncinatum]KAF3480550.1 ROT1 protein [Arthroderma uncinatum]